MTDNLDISAADCRIKRISLKLGCVSARLAVHYCRGPVLPVRRHIDVEPIVPLVAFPERRRNAVYRIHIAEVYHRIFAERHARPAGGEVVVDDVLPLVLRLRLRAYRYIDRRQLIELHHVCSAGDEVGHNRHLELSAIGIPYLDAGLFVRICRVCHLDNRPRVCRGDVELRHHSVIYRQRTGNRRAVVLNREIGVEVSRRLRLPGQFPVGKGHIGNRLDLHSHRAYLDDELVVAGSSLVVEHKFSVICVSILLRHLGRCRQRFRVAPVAPLCARAGVDKVNPYRLAVLRQVNRVAVDIYLRLGVERPHTIRVRIKCKFVTVSHRVHVVVNVISLGHLGRFVVHIIKVSIHKSAVLVALRIYNRCKLIQFHLNALGVVLRIEHKHIVTLGAFAVDCVLGIFQLVLQIIVVRAEVICPSLAEQVEHECAAVVVLMVTARRAEVS